MKAILVIDDMPKTCGGCPCMRVSNTGFVCQKEWRDVVDPDHIPSWCPVKPMPEKLYVEANSIEDLMPSEFDMDKFVLKIRLDADKLCALGWNACLKEIENESRMDK